MPRWGMVIDLRKCIGCNTCAYVCKHVNDVPANADWRQLVECEIDRKPKGQKVFLTMSCMHCSEPPCLEVCPSKATYIRPDGIVDINYELCVGCAACVVACPYHARSITVEDKVDITPDQQDFIPSDSDRIGICTKCNFCQPIVEAGLSQGLKPGVDPEATPICVRYCIAEALQFGDLDDPDSQVSSLIRENKTARLQEELGTDPSVYYILKGEQ